MKIAYLAGRDSVHTVRWVNEMTKRGHEIHLISMHHNGPPLDKGVMIHCLPIKAPWGYLLNALILKRYLQLIDPELLHVHYASGYGTLGRLSGFHPLLLSCWGSDILCFPYEAIWKKKLLIKNILNADSVSSVCQLLKNEIYNLTNISDTEVVPFGIDCSKFYPVSKDPSERIRIGTIKSLAPVYGISTLIKAFAICLNKGLQSAELVIVGSGPQENELRLLTRSLGIEEQIIFTGSISSEEVPVYLNSFDIFLALSESEGLSVSVMEASACQLPVIVSDVGGLPETLVNGKTGFVVPRNNPEEAAERIMQLAHNPTLRKEMGEAGRQFVMVNYEWGKNADNMERLYEEVVKEYKR